MPPIAEKLVKLRTEDPLGFLQNFVFYPGQSKAVGLKFKYEELSLDAYATILPWLCENRDIRIIHLTRRNLLKRYLSQYTATTFRWQRKASGSELTLWRENAGNKQATAVFNVSGSTEPPPRPRTTFLADECEREFAHTEERYRRFAKLFEHHDVLNLTYEGLVGDKEQTLIEVQDFLGVPPADLHTGLKKINPDSLRSLIENYDELAEHFRGTRFEPFFE